MILVGAGSAGCVLAARLSENSGRSILLLEAGPDYPTPAGTCRMGPAADATAVVDSQVSVHGVEGLSVVDASIMPGIPAANTNLPTLMLAERCPAWLAEIG